MRIPQEMVIESAQNTTESCHAYASVTSISIGQGDRRRNLQYGACDAGQIKT